MRGRSSLVWIALFLVAIAVGFMAQPGRSDGAAMDPSSTAPDGARALRELLDRYATNVSTDGFGDSTDTVIMLDDFLGADDSDRLEAWVRDGGHLVWLDNRSTFGPIRPEASSVISAESDRIEVGECSIAAIADLSVVSAPGLRLFATDQAVAVCFATRSAGTAGGTAAVAEFGLGQGRVTVVASTMLVDNEHLGTADNAAMIVRLSTAGGARRIAVLHPSTMAPTGPAVDGDIGLFDLIPARVNVFLAQLVVAAGLWLWFRGRRFGKVVNETQLVEIPASLIIRSTAELQRRAGGDDWARTALQSDMLARLRTEHRLGPESDIETVAATVANRTGYPATNLMDILRPNTNIDLVHLVGQIDEASRHVFTQPPTMIDTSPGHPISGGAPSTSTNQPLSTGSPTP